jgi:hypothetical protein
LGNAALISSADSAMRAMADLVLSNDNITVQQRHESIGRFHLLELQLPFFVVL